MLYIDFVAGGKEYKLRLTTRAMILLEKKTGGNPLNIFLKNIKGEIPRVEDMVYILHASLQPYHNSSYEEACDIFDKWLEDGHLISDFVAIMTEIYQEAGILAKGDTTEKN